MTQYSALKLMFGKLMDTVLGGPSLGDTLFLKSSTKEAYEFIPATKFFSGIDHKLGLLPATKVFCLRFVLKMCRILDYNLSCIISWGVGCRSTSGK